VPKTKSQKETLKQAYDEVVAKRNFVVVKIANIPAVVLTQMRKQLSALNASFTIVKNTVFTKSLEPVTKDITMEGPLAVLEGGNDIASALKSFDAATKEAKAVLSLSGADESSLKSYSPFTYKYGVIQESILDASQVQRLSQLPDKNTVIAQFVGTMAAPLSSTMNVMNGVLRNMVYVLTDLKNKKSE